MKSVTKKLCAILIMVCVVFAMMPVFGGGTADAKSKIKLNKKTVYIVKGKTYKLKIKGTSAKVKWKSSNTKIATVSKTGKVKGKKAGTCTITAKVKGKKYKCKVTVDTKSANQARKLRDYILKKGKYNKLDKYYYITKRVQKEEGWADVEIRATKASKKLVFDWSNVLETPSESRHVTVTINLIKSTSPKSGKIYWKWIEGYSEYPPEDEYNGTITTSFNGDAKGLTLTSGVRTDYDVDEETNDATPVVKKITDKHDLDMFASTVGADTKEMFADMKPLFKKAGVTVKSIGFSKM